MNANSPHTVSSHGLRTSKIPTKPARSQTTDVDSDVLPQQVTSQADNIGTSLPAKRRRGRPPKRVVQVKIDDKDHQMRGVEPPVVVKRPRKKRAKATQQPPAKNARKKKESRVTLSPPEKFRIRREKAEALGLHYSSPFPLFSHDLSVQEIAKHPHIDSWHAHREALQTGKIAENQPQPHFLPARGSFVFPKKQRAVHPDGEPARSQKKASKARIEKMKVLQLHPKSSIPIFAQHVHHSILKRIPLHNSWHEHRIKVEKGELDPKDLPPEFSSSVSSGKLIFKSPTRRGPLVKDAHLTRLDKLKILTSERRAKIKVLGLHRSSTQPIFAQRLKAKDLEAHDEINNWHHHRKLMEKGHITVNALPEHFKPYKGKFQFREAVSNAAQSPVRQSRVPAQTAQLHPSDTQEASQYVPQPDHQHVAASVGPSSSSDSDPFAFLHSMQLD